MPPLMHQRLCTDTNPIEQLQSILKKVVYKGKQQFTSKDAHWNKIVDIDSTIKPSQINRLTSCVNSRLLIVISRNESYVDKLFDFVVHIW